MVQLVVLAIEARLEESLSDGNHQQHDYTEYQHSLYPSVLHVFGPPLPELG